MCAQSLYVIRVCVIHSDNNSNTPREILCITCLWNFWRTPNFHLQDVCLFVCLFTWSPDLNKVLETAGILNDLNMKLFFQVQ